MTKLDDIVRSISAFTMPEYNDLTEPSFIIEISTCGYADCCMVNGEQLTGEIAEDMMACTGPGDAEPACRYILDNYRPEFRIVKRIGDKYRNIVASAEDKAAACNEIFFDPLSDTDFSDENYTDLYLVWEAAHSLEREIIEAE